MKGLESTKYQIIINARIKIKKIELQNVNTLIKNSLYKIQYLI